MNRIALEPGVGSDRGLAAGFEEVEEVALGSHAEVGLAVVDGGESLEGVGLGFVDFDADGSLAGGWEKFLGIEDGGGVGLEKVVHVEADEAGVGEDDGVPVVIIGELLDAGGNVSPNVDDFEIGPEHLELCGAADAAGGDGGAGWKAV